MASIMLVALIVLLAVSFLVTLQEFSRKRSGLDHNFDLGLKAAGITAVGLVAMYFQMSILPVVAAIAVIVLLLSTFQPRQ